jgi:hypothetical protein
MSSAEVDPVTFSTMDCRNCHQGLLEFVIRVDTGEIYLECDECMTGFTEVVDGRLGRGFFAGTVEWEARSATLEEITASDLAWSIRA